MPLPTPFHPRTFAACESLFYKDWAGWWAVRSYDTHHEAEYYALRHATGVIDVSPLFKYDVTGPDAAAFLSGVMARNVTRLAVGQVAYLCWCDDAGHVIDDGTVARLDETHFRATSAEPAWHWFVRHARGYDVRIEDVTARLAALSVQGPTSRHVVDAASDGAVGDLRFFRLTRARIGGADVVVTRTGYTGDLGYEIWVDADRAVALWDAVLGAGRPFGVTPAGLDAMDVTRIEAGFVLNGVDYYSALHAMIDSRKSTPFELGLGWTVHTRRGPFVGREALRREKRRGRRRAVVGLVLDWDEYEALFREHGLPPEVPSGAWRDGRPVYDLEGRFIGQATSGAWSPLLKKDLALANVPAAFAEPGTRVRIEVTVEYERRTVTATVTERPFFDPPRKRARGPHDGARTG